MPTERHFFLDDEMEQTCVNSTQVVMQQIPGYDIPAIERAECGSITKSRSQEMQIFFKSKMTVSEQLLSYGFLSYIAENGGFIGLFLGYPVLQLRDIIAYVFDNKGIVSTIK